MGYLTGVSLNTGIRQGIFCLTGHREQTKTKEQNQEKFCGNTFSDDEKSEY